MIGLPTLPRHTPSGLLGPVILSTDLNHPYGDPDDHIDCAVAAGLDLDVRAVILDRHPHLDSGSGVAPISQLNYITGKNWPYHQGLVLGGTGTALVGVLSALTEPVTIVVLGSCRDVADAIVTAPAVCATKIERIVVFAGDASSTTFQETNVWLDPEAFTTVMTSGLPVYWVPCFDGGLWSDEFGTTGFGASFVSMPQAEAFPSTLNARLRRFFTYRLRTIATDPIAWVDGAIEAADTTALTTGTRNVWCGGLLGPVCSTIAEAGGGGRTVARFRERTVRFGDDGVLNASGSHLANVQAFSVVNQHAWERMLRSSTVAALHNVP